MTGHEAAPRPRSLDRAMLGLWILLGLGAVVTALAWVLEDSLVRSWAEGNATAREILARGGLDAVREGPVQVPGFVPVAVVLFLVMAGLVWVLAVFVKAGHEWARISLAVLLVLAAISVVAGIRTDPPTTFVVCAALALVVEAVVLVFLFHPDTTAYLHPRRDRDPQPHA